MTQEEEQLLFDDLSGRLRYGVICQIDYHDDAALWGIPNADTFTFCDGVIERYISQVKPYLRPISSMTNEELTDLLAYSGIREHEIEICKYDGVAELEFWLTEVPCKCINKVIDWLNKNMFDYRGLIPMGLALEATEGMYNN